MISQPDLVPTFTIDLKPRTDDALHQPVAECNMEVDAADVTIMSNPDR
jgi:hypothetical protein